MFELLLVDDEPVIRMTFRNLLSWDETPWHIAGMVANGQEALAFLNTHQVDIIVTDIKMPHMSGLELIHRLQKQNYLGAILVLSNYSDFSLVRQAMNLGAKDYILKADLDEPVMYEALSRLSEHLTVCEALPAMGAQTSIDGLRRTILRNTLLGFTLPEETPENMSLLPYAPYVLLDVHIAENLRRSVSYKSIRNVLLANFNEQTDVICLSDYEYICFVPWQEDISVMLNRSRQMIRQLKLYLNCEAKISISSVFSDVEEMCHQLVQCKQAAQLFFYPAIESCLPAENIKLQSSTGEPVPEVVVQHLKTYQTDSINQWLLLLLQRCAEHHVNPDALKKYAADILQLILQEYPDLPEEMLFSSHVDIFACKSSEQLQGVFIETLHAIREKSTTPDSATNESVCKIKDYLQENFSERITLDMLASLVNLERSYLSRLFKKEAGVNIFQYLADIRLKEAQRLLSQGRMSVREVASKVGIEDPFYFTRMFKKQYGMSPTDYVQQGKDAK